MISWLRLLSRCDRYRRLCSVCGWYGSAGTSGEDIVCWLLDYDDFVAFLFEVVLS